MYCSLILSMSLASSVTAPVKPTSEIQQAVNTGLKWLAKQQKADGSWPGGPSDMPTLPTACAGLALLMEGSTPIAGDYAANIRKAVAWFEKHTTKDGRLACNNENEAYQYIQSHATALQFLTCVYDVDDDEDRRARLRKQIENAVGVLVKAQCQSGGWGYADPASTGNYDDSVSTGLVLQTLFAVRRVGITFPKQVTDRGVDYLVAATNPEGAVIFSTTGNGTPMERKGFPRATAFAGAALIVSDSYRPKDFSGWIRNTVTLNAEYLPLLRQSGGVYALNELLPTTQLAYLLGEKGHRRLAPQLREAELLKWSNYRNSFLKQIKSLQQKDGSWSDIGFGAEHTTAIALFIMQLDNGYVPLFAR